MSRKEWTASEISGEWWDPDQDISGVNRPTAGVITPHNFSVVGNIKNPKKEENNPLSLLLKKFSGFYFCIFPGFLFTRIHCAGTVSVLHFGYCSFKVMFSFFGVGMGIYSSLFGGYGNTGHVNTVAYEIIVSRIVVRFIRVCCSGLFGYCSPKIRFHLNR